MSRWDLFGVGRSEVVNIFVRVAMSVGKEWNIGLAEASRTSLKKETSREFCQSSLSCGRRFRSLVISSFANNDLGLDERLSIFSGRGLVHCSVERRKASIERSFFLARWRMLRKRRLCLCFILLTDLL